MTTPKCVFNDSIRYMKDLIGKTIEITTIENVSHVGQVYVIDPRSKTVVLTIKNEQKSNILIIPHHSIKSLEVTPTPSREDLALTNIAKSSISEEELQQKKARMKNWLEENLIEVTEDVMKLKIGNHIVMEPPYSAENILCGNAMVLHRLLDLIGKMPDE